MNHTVTSPPTILALLFDAIRVFGNSGAAGLYSTVARMSGDPKLFVRGVVSTLPNGTGDESAVDVNLINNGAHTPLHLDIIQPQGISHPFANFAEEVTRKQFLSQVGHAIIHSKIVVVDPFPANPTVITGSQNFSTSASAKNDENFIMIKGDKDLAEAYAVNIEGAYRHYVYRAFLDKTNRPFNGLKDNDTWQAPKRKKDRSHHPILLRLTSLSSTRNETSGSKVPAPAQQMHIRCRN